MPEPADRGHRSATARLSPWQGSRMPAFIMVLVHLPTFEVGSHIFNPGPLNTAMVVSA
jgi:hypothetical protein